MGLEKAYEVRLQCAGTVFHIYLYNENESEKIALFLENINTVKNLALQDIYHWCNRHQVVYETKFQYNRKRSLIRNAGSFLYYLQQKNKYFFIPRRHHGSEYIGRQPVSYEDAEKE